MGIPEIISLVAAIIAVAGAAFTWGQVPRPRLVMPPIFVDDTDWHGPADKVSAVVGIQNQGSGPALAVTLYVKGNGKWRQTRSSDYWPALQPGESIALTRTQLLLDVSRRDDKHLSGVGGYAQFDGMKVKVRWRSNFGWWRIKVFDVDAEHSRTGRATRLDPSVVRYFKESGRMIPVSY